MESKCRGPDLLESTLSPSTAAQAIKVLNMIKVYGKPIRVNKASQDKRSQDIGANLFIGNLDPEVDEKVCQCAKPTVPFL